MKVEWWPLYNSYEEIVDKLLKYSVEMLFEMYMLNPYVTINKHGLTKLHAKDWIYLFLFFIFANFGVKFLQTHQLFASAEPIKVIVREYLWFESQIFWEHRTQKDALAVDHFRSNECEP